MTTIITITAEEIGTISTNFYDYSGEDRILKNIISGDYEVLYSGQNQGRMDYQLIDAVNSDSVFRIYYRKKNNSPFTFIGETHYSTIIKERVVGKGINALPTQRLQIRFVIHAINIKNILIDTEFEGVGCYKKAVLQHSHFPTDLNVNLGFYTTLRH